METYIDIYKVRELIMNLDKERVLRKEDYNQILKMEEDRCKEKR